jgi:hypothetical protein
MIGSHPFVEERGPQIMVQVFIDGTARESTWAFAG